MEKTFISTVKHPSVYITKNKQRVKQFGDSVYLNNGDEFEIELYNDTQIKVLAEIEVNGNSIGERGIILRPGERVFLERYLNDTKKFLFETYKVDGEDSHVQKAIEKNGNLSVKFFKEIVKPTVNYGTNYPFIGSLLTNGTFNTYGAITFNSTSSVSNLYPPNNTFLPKSTYNSGSIETGRIERGSNSNQSFAYDNSTFDSFFTWVKNWKIIPNSRKPLVEDDFKVFCSECGSKRKKDTHVFCTYCGTKFLIKNKTKIFYTDSSTFTYGEKNYFLQTCNTTLDEYLERHKNKTIVILRNSLTENELRGCVID